MISQDKIDFFHTEGYLVIPGVLSAEEVKHMRERITKIFETGEWKKSEYNTGKVLSDVYQTFPEFIDITLKPQVLEVVSSLLGPNPVLLPETAIHHKFYSTWHKDTTSHELAGHTFHLQDAPQLIQSGFYLQDNDQYGGGLTVMPGSHKYKDYYGQKNVSTFFTRVINKLMGRKPPANYDPNLNNLKILDIPSKAGDLVVFDMRTNHAATFPTACKISEVPDSISKIALFNGFCVNNDTAPQYLNYIKTRKEPYYQSLHHRSISEALKKKAAELAFTAY